MSALTYSSETAAAVAAGTAAPESVQPKGVWHRLFDRIIASRQTRAEREIAAYIASRGGLFNDEIERQIMQRLSGGPSRSV